jgi:non-specific protein-tyrosine kinase
MVLVRRKWIVISAIVACGCLAFLATQLQTPMYTASSRVLIQKPSVSALFDSAGNQRFNPDLVAEIELQVFNSEDVRKQATTELGGGATVIASSGGRGSVMTVTATDKDPKRAADVANAYTKAYLDVRKTTMIDDYTGTAQATQSKIDAIDQQLQKLDEQAAAAAAQNPEPTPTEKPKDKNAAPVTTIDTTTTTSASDKAQRDTLAAQKQVLQKNLDTLQISQQNAQTGGPQVLAPATPPASPSSPNPKRDTLAGILFGIVLGIAAAFLVDFLDDSIKSHADAEAAIEGVPILAIIPYLNDWRNRTEAHLASIEQPASPTSEAYRTLRTSVQFAGLERPIHTLQVTSPRAQDGKSTTSANLAVALARAGLRVILVDCDLRRPRVHEFLGLSNAVGFTSVLLGTSTVADAIQSYPGLDTFRVLASGPIPPNPSELLSGRRTADLVEALKASADIVVFDTPPVLPVSDALVVSDLMDAVIIVVAAGSTTKKQAHRASILLRQVAAPLIGTVMNNGPDQSGYGYGYNATYTYEQAKPKGLALTGRRKRSGSAPVAEDAPSSHDRA